MVSSGFLDCGVFWTVVAYEKGWLKRSGVKKNVAPKKRLAAENVCVSDSWPLQLAISGTKKIKSKM